MNELIPLNRRKGGSKTPLIKFAKFISEEIEQSDTKKNKLLDKFRNKFGDLKIDHCMKF